jgi:hypothetical protein
MAAHLHVCCGRCRRRPSRAQECFVLRNPHNKLKGGPGPVEDTGDAAKTLTGRHRATSIPDAECWLQSVTRKKKAADTFLMPISTAHEAGVFESIILLTRKAGTKKV